MKAAAFTHHQPATVADAVALLARYAPAGGRIIAGGQSLVTIMALRLAQPPHLIDIGEIPGLDTIGVEGGVLHVGALVRHAAMARLPGDIPGAALLARIARHIAHRPIRTRGTVCGSLAYADPASEWCLTLVALGGRVIAAGPAGERAIAAGDYFRGIMTTALAEDEMIVRAEFDLPPAGWRCGFEETSRRAGDYAMAMALAMLRLEDGRIVDARVAIGGAEPVPRRHDTPGLIGAAPGDFDDAAGAVAAAIDPITDHQVDAGLRRDLVRAMTRRALHRAMADA